MCYYFLLYHVYWKLWNFLHKNNVFHTSSAANSKFFLVFQKVVWSYEHNINLQIKENITSYNYVLVSTKISSRSKPFKRPVETQFSSSLRVSLNVYLSKDLAWLLDCSTRSSI